MRKLVAAIACRCEGSRLYGKPLQNLDIESGYTILDNIVECLRLAECIEDIALGISEGPSNSQFHQFGSREKLKTVTGDEEDVLSRLIRCGEIAEATDIFRVTSESPFPCFDLIDTAWQAHQAEEADATFLDHVIDGCNFEIVRLSALIKSHDAGNDRHRSELCTLYIRENKSDFNISYVDPPRYLKRKDLRLTVDYPEDLVVARAVYEEFKCRAPEIPLDKVVAFLDSKPDLLRLIQPFCEAGYETMYV